MGHQGRRTEGGQGVGVESMDDAHWWNQEPPRMVNIILGRIWATCTDFTEYTQVGKDTQNH